MIFLKVLVFNIITSPGVQVAVADLDIFKRIPPYTHLSRGVDLDKTLCQLSD